jgi:phage terminase large subunit
MEFILTTAIRKLLRLKQRIKVISESIPHLRRGALKDFLKIIMALGRYNDAQFNKSTLKYSFTNGSYIEFFSVDQPDKLRGARRTHIIC